MEQCFPVMVSDWSSVHQLTQVLDSLLSGSCPGRSTQKKLGDPACSGQEVPYRL